MYIPKEMKAARFYEINEPIQIDTVPVPEIKEYEVLVQLKSVGLCGSDIHMVYEGEMVPVHHPIIIGHEPSGVIASKGAAVNDWEVGARVSVYPIIYCGSCKNCIAGHSEICSNLEVLGVHRDGGLAEYIAIPAKNLVKLPDNIPFHVGSIVTDAVATPFHAMIERAQLRLGESVAIFGVGGLGLHAVQIAKMAGAKQIIAIDILDEQLEKAKELGADIVINPLYESPVEVIKKHTGFGVDVAAEFIGKKETVTAAANSLTTGGRLVVSGIGYESIELMSVAKYVRKQLTIYGSFGHTKNTVQQLINLVSSKRLFLEESITHEFQLEEVNTALEYLYKKIDNPTRVLINI
ncbi:zinc-binding dehydrogenase [Oceanobacillus longus]|uniref:Zinc-binding dehydrogenase n=1 Tax=Oceanobacillus longus TaxID=930120 RepID=A0ABV8GWX5_9BACI